MQRYNNLLNIPNISTIILHLSVIFIYKVCSTNIHNIRNIRNILAPVIGLCRTICHYVGASDSSHASDIAVASDINIASDICTITRCPYTPHPMPKQHLQSHTHPSESDCIRDISKPIED